MKKNIKAILEIKNIAKIKNSVENLEDNTVAYLGKENKGTEMIKVMIERKKVRPIQNSQYLINRGSEWEEEIIGSTENADAWGLSLENSDCKGQWVELMH